MRYPFVVVRIGCDLCERAGAYRLARLAEKFGAGISLDELLSRRVLVRLVGVTLTSLQPQGVKQGQLFAEQDTARKKLFEAVDAVRKRHGFGALVVGAASELLGQLPHGPDGFQLRTPSLTK